MTIIDMHTHLGDILNFGGGRTIFQKGVTKKGFFDLVSITEKGLYRTNAILEWFLQVFCTDLITRSCLSRNATATLENMQKAMKGNNVVKSVCLPVPPYVHFEDLKKAKDIGNFVVPFTGVDFSKDYDVEASFKSDVAKGAKGLKLHPIIQKEPLKSKKTYAVIETFSAFGLPVLFHSGVQSYYLGREKKEKQKPEYGKSDDALGIVKAFPDMIFIIGHAGIFQYREIMELFSRFKNTYVDTSFQSPARIRELVKAFGPDRVMFGSDWPWGDLRTNIVALSKACRGDRYLERALFYDNAARILNYVNRES